MDSEPGPGQLTASVGKVCLLFKNPAEAKGGQVFVRCTFDNPRPRGLASILFPDAVPAVGTEVEAAAAAPAAAAPDNNAVSAALPPIESEPVDIVFPLGGNADSIDPPDVEADGGGNTALDPDAAAEVEEAVAGAAAQTATEGVVVDLGFSFQSAKFALTEDNMTQLGVTEMKIEVCMRGGGAEGTAAATSGVEVVTVIGTTTARVVDVLQGKNTWSESLALGEFAIPSEELSETAGSRLTAQGQDGARDDEVEPAPETEPRSAGEMSLEIKDDSTGPLRLGGSTSTVCVSLATDDDTADYTVGAGSLWVDGATIVGVPESWKIQPPAGTSTEYAAWNDAIAHILAGPRRHSYSLFWPGGEEPDCGGGPDVPKLSFPPMRLTGGVLRYIPDEEEASAESQSLQDSDTACSGKNEPDTARSTSASKGKTAAGGDDTSTSQPTKPPPTGMWSVEFPSAKKEGVFLHRGAIRSLRGALTVAGEGTDAGTTTLGSEGAENTAEDSSTSTILPVFLERRPLPQVPPPGADQPSGGAKKKGGKKGADKAAAVEQPVVPPETPWQCKAFIDLSVLGARSWRRTGVKGRGDDKSRQGSSASLLCGDSPLRAECSAKLALDLPTVNAGEVTTQNGAEGGEAVNPNGRKSAGASPPAVDLANVDGSSGDPPKATEAEIRREQMENSDPRLTITFALTRPLAKGTVCQESGASVSDIFIPKDVGPRKPPRDVELELKEEMDTFVVAVLTEYAKIFLQPNSKTPLPAADELSAEGRENRLFYALNSTGLYHSFVERLKPRVQRVVRKRFGAVPADPAEADAFVAGLYAHLVEQAAIVLNERIKNTEAKATRSYVTTDEEKSLCERVQHLGNLADDAEARDDRHEAAARHEDRIEVATAAAAAREDWRGLLGCAWEDYGRFSLRGRGRQQRQNGVGDGRGGEEQRLPSNFDYGARCFEEALGVYPLGSDESLSVTAMLVAVALNQGQIDRASALLSKSRGTRLPKMEEGADGYETDQLAKIIPRREHALECLIRDYMEDSQGARRSLFLAVLVARREADAGTAGAIVADDEPLAPRRTAVRVMQDLCTWLLDLGLPTAAQRANKVAEESERLAVKKAQERVLSTRTPTTLRESSRRLKSRLILAEGNVEGRNFGQDAEMLALEAVELVPEDPRPWQALAEACDAQGAIKASEAADAWAAVLDRMEENWKTASGEMRTTTAPPLRVYMRLGSLYNTLGRTDDAKACFLRACRVWRAPGPWLGCGAACLRLEQWEEAEDALQHASRLDCNSPLVWGYLALLSLSMGEDRVKEGDRALSQALQLGLADASLLREIGNCYVATGRLEAAERVLRMSLAADAHGTGGNPHTRRRLADVLSARNATTQAVQEYQRVLESPSTEDAEKQEVLVRCANLLRKMGRTDEINQLQKAVCVARAASDGAGEGPQGRANLLVHEMQTSDGEIQPNSHEIQLSAG